MSDEYRIIPPAELPRATYDHIISPEKNSCPLCAAGHKPKLKFIEITPSPDGAFDSIVVPAQNSWADTLHFIEEALEKLVLDPDLKWSDITLNLRGVEMTSEEFEELCQR